MDKLHLILELLKLRISLDTTQAVDRPVGAGQTAGPHRSVDFNQGFTFGAPSFLIYRLACFAASKIPSSTAAAISAVASRLGGEERGADGP